MKKLIFSMISLLGLLFSAHVMGEEHNKDMKDKEEVVEQDKDKKDETKANEEMEEEKEDEDTTNDKS